MFKAPKYYLKLSAVFILSIFLTSCFKNLTIPHECYWMDCQSGACQWRYASEVLKRNLSEFECYQMDSCDGGLGQSGGGCYKWSILPISKPVGWDKFKKANN